MPRMQLKLDSIPSAMCGIGKMDARSKCILLAAILTAVLPLEIHHLMAAVLGAAGYMFMQWLEPTVKRQPEGAPPRRPYTEKPSSRLASSAARGNSWEERRSRGFTAAEDQKWSALRAVPAAPAVKPDVKRPSVMPVKAPKFAASNWQEEVNELLETLKPNAASREQVEQIARAVKRSLGPVLPGAAVDAFSLARPMAGTAFGVAVPEVEVVVTLEGKGAEGADGKLQKSLIRTCTDRLVSQDSFKFRRSAFRGAEPKVTLITPPEQGNMPFNLAVNALMPARCSELFKACEMDPVAIELILLVRRWAKDRGISHAAKGHLSPYSWMLLAIYYLQVGTHQLPAMSFVVSKRDRPEPSPEKNNVSAGELLQGFMKFYASFDWAKENISVRQGQGAAPTRPLMLLHEDGKTQPGPCIEDPFETSNNLGSCMHWLSMSRLQEEFARGVQLSGASLAELLEPWTPPDHADAD